jgi:hypothetical protein
MTINRMSDTPRTDAVEGYDDEYSNPELLALCRELERENSHLRGQLSAVLQSTGYEAREIVALREMLMKCRNESDDFELHCEIDAILFKGKKR